MATHPGTFFSDIIAKAQEQNTEETAIAEPSSAGQCSYNVNTQSGIKPELKHIQKKKRQPEQLLIMRQVGCITAKRSNVKGHVHI